MGGEMGILTVGVGMEYTCGSCFEFTSVTWIMVVLS